MFDIHVSPHARERARERFPGYKAARIVDEVRLALGAGRLSPRKPPGVANLDDPDSLYAWTPCGERVFVLAVNQWDGGDSFIVKTVIRAAVAA
jgi:hypothetical protein